MQTVPPYLSDTIMPLYKFALIFAFMLGFASIFTGIGYALYTYASTELSFLSSMYLGFILFLKGAGLTAVISFFGLMAFWKKYKISLQNCKESQSKNCFDLGFFNYA